MAHARMVGQRPTLARPVAIISNAPQTPQRGKRMSWADKFNLLNPLVDLRLICALFFIPHVVGKFTEPATLGFFKAAKFNPPATWMYIAGTIETCLTIALVLDIYTGYVAAIAAFHLFVAGAATYKVTTKWIWVIGGIEYCVFWMLTCVVLAMLTWPK